jgi:hypothetical protein
MLESVEGSFGDLLALDAYLGDFDRYFSAALGHEVWKVERRQHFRQPENASWTAFSEGRWADALRLLEEDRSALEEEFAAFARAGVVVRRVRVVEWPLDPYLQWELHSLHLRALCGEQIRIVGPDAVAAFEKNAPVPEVVTLGTSVAYEIRYTAEGILDGGVRITAPEIVSGRTADIAGLFAVGEDIGPCFARDIAPLPPPNVDREDVRWGGI